MIRIERAARSVSYRPGRTDSVDEGHWAGPSEQCGPTGGCDRSAAAAARPAIGQGGLRRSDCLLAAAVVLAVCPVSFAHPFHTSIAEAQFNRQTGKLEVALRVNPGDLEEALRPYARQHVDLEKTEDVDRLIVAYLRERFVVSSQQKRPLPIEWLGKEVSMKYAWLYFEIPIPQLTGDLVVSNRVFFELLKDQVNTVTFRQQRVRQSISFNRDRATQQLTLPLRPAPADSNERSDSNGLQQDHRRN